MKAGGDRGMIFHDRSHPRVEFSPVGATHREREKAPETDKRTWLTVNHRGSPKKIDVGREQTDGNR